jgi:hypothetical protein
LDSISRIIKIIAQNRNNDSSVSETQNKYLSSYKSLRVLTLFSILRSVFLKKSEESLEAKEFQDMKEVGSHAGRHIFLGANNIRKHES